MKNDVLDDRPDGRGVLLFLLGLAIMLTAGLFSLPTPASDDGGAADEATGEAAGGFVVTGARVFDGEHIHDGVDVWVEGGRIAGLGPDLASTLAADVPRIDGAGHTLLPGLIDAHVHTWGTARRDAVRFGVTTMLDQFSALDEVTAGRADREGGGADDRADLFSAGTLATAEGGHGTQFGTPVETLDGPDGAGAWVDARLAEGSDWIKIVVEPGWGERGLATLDLDTVAALIDAAHARGALAVVHVSRLVDALEVAKRGADGLVHVWRDAVPSAEQLTAFKEAGLFVIPTMVVAEGMGDPSPSLALAEGEWGERLSTAQRGSLGRRFPPAARVDMEIVDESVRLLAAAGVPILAGSDAPNPATAMGLSLHRELALLVAAGLDERAALAAATSAPARAFDLGGPIRGRLEEGALADLVLVAGDPLADIAATRDIRRVWKAGREVDLDAPAESETDQAMHDEVAPAPEGELISDFESGLEGRYGAGWSETTDQIRGGHSQVTLEVADGVLVVRGEVETGAMFPWAGAMVFVGPVPMQPADLSGRRELTFRVRGDGRRYSAMLFSGDMQGIPPTRTFETTDAWQTVTFELESFHQADPGALRAVAFTAGAPTGPFRFELDDVAIR